MACLPFFPLEALVLVDFVVLELDFTDLDVLLEELVFFVVLFLACRVEAPEIETTNTTAHSTLNAFL